MNRRPNALRSLLTRSLPLAVMTLLTAFCLLPSAFSQSATATISGTVVDQQGAVVPGATVTVINAATGQQRQATTGDEGNFTVPSLPPATYTIRVEREGFAIAEVSNVVLNVNDQKSISIPLKAGTISEMVKITGEAPLINESPAVATTIDRTFVGNLPLNGRSFQSLILLTPGVTLASDPAASDPGQFSVNGQRASTNYFTVDGAGANIGTSTQGGGGKSLQLAGSYPGISVTGGTSNLVSIDALEEFKIQTSTYTAEFGRQPGGQVQIVTKSGKNEFHSTLFEYFRNEALDARNYFNRKPAPQTPLRQNNYGGTFSGPIFMPRFGEGGPSFYNGRDRTFFFFSYEAQRLRLPVSGVLNVPSVRLRNLAFATLRPLLNALPIPTGPETTTTTPCTLPNPTCNPATLRLYSGAAPFNFSVADPTNLDSTGIRIDHTVSDKLTLFGRFNESPSDAFGGISPRFQNFANTRTLTLSATSVFNTRLTNELRFNYSRQQAKGILLQSSIGGAVPIDPAVFTNGLSGTGSVLFQFGSLSAQLSGGTVADSYQRQVNIVDNVSLIRGQHGWKIGLDFRRLSPTYGIQASQIAQFQSESAIRNGLINFLGLGTVQPSRPQFDNYSAYVQDTWKASRRMTLDLGVRWELNPAPTEAEGRMPPIALNVVGTNVTGATLAPPGTQFYKTFYTAFAPRFGAAYLLSQKAGRETVLRGGFGVYYDLGGGTASGGWPITANRMQFAPTPECPLIFPIASACAARPGIVPVTTLPTTTTVRSPNENLKLPYSLHWNLAIEQSLGNAQAVSISYVGSAGRRLLTTQTLNQQPRNPLTGAALPRPNPNFGSIVYSFNGPSSDYNSMQAQYRSRLTQGLQALVNYTWSHAIDEVSNDIGAGIK